MKLKKYQINYLSQGKVVSEIIEAVSRKAAREYMETIGFKHINTKEDVLRKI